SPTAAVDTHRSAVLGLGRHARAHAVRPARAAGRRGNRARRRAAVRRAPPSREAAQLMYPTAPLRTKRVTFAPRGHLVIDEVDCTVDTGALTALVGPNGAGKSTLLRLIAAAEQPTSGSIWLDAAESRSLKRAER